MSDLALVPERPQPEAGVWARLDMIQPKDPQKAPYPRGSLRNAITVLQWDTRLQDRIAFDEFGNKLIYKDRPLNDVDEIAFREWIDLVYFMRLSKETAHDAFMRAAHARTFHPVRDYLDGLEWDGIERLPTWLHVYCGAPDDILSSAFGRRWAISAVARVYDPGCQVDSVLVLQGPQGVRKSSIFRLLGNGWFSDSEIDIRKNDAYLKIQGVWIYEMQEIDGLSRNETYAVKAFITSREDNYRPPYGRNRVIVKRQGVFVGTVNPTTFLHDPTGQRRWWPVSVARADDVSLAEIRDQFWAEAVVLYKRGEQWHLDEIENQARIDDENRWVTIDPWFGAVSNYVSANPAAKSISEILEHAIKMPLDRQNRGHAMKVGRILESLGWEKGKRVRNESGQGPKQRQQWQKKAPQD